MVPVLWFGSRALILAGARPIESSVLRADGAAADPFVAHHQCER